MKKKKERKKKEKKKMEKKIEDRRGKLWTKEEEELLMEYWGVYSTPTIAKRLGRTELGVRKRAALLGLGRHIDNSDLIPFSILLREFKVRNSYRIFLDKFNAAGFQFHTQRVNKRSVKMVDIDEFWKFAEKNKNLLNFSKLEENTFGVEPDWVKKERTKAFTKKISKKRHYVPWTENDDKELLRLVRSGQYSYKDIAKRLMRTENAIDCRLRALGERMKFVPAQSVTWTSKEVLHLDKMIREEKSLDEISSFFNRSTITVRRKINRMYSGLGIAEIQKKLRNGEEVVLNHF